MLGFSFSGIFSPAPPKSNELPSGSCPNSSSAPSISSHKNMGRTFADMERKYKTVRTIGSGGFGKVYSGFRRTDKQPVAIKVVNGKKVTSYRTMKGQQVPLEVAMHSKVSHLPGVVKLLDHFQGEGGNGSHILVLERPDPVQDLFDFITQRGALDEFIARVFFRQIVETIAACHDNGVCHRDIKDENILVDMHTGRCYLIDFGSSDELRTEPYQGYDAGTKVYCPPEWVKTGVFHASAGTVWSLGILLYDMLCGDIPFENEEQILSGHLSWRNPAVRISDRARDLVRRCLTFKPEQRLTIAQILEHPWLNQCKFDDNFAYYFQSYCSRRTHRMKTVLNSTSPIAVPSSITTSSAPTTVRQGVIPNAGLQSQSCSFTHVFSSSSHGSAGSPLSPQRWTFDCGSNTQPRNDSLDSQGNSEGKLSLSGNSIGEMAAC
ncbi:hypothetical protein RvY_05421 [Ramazzottius varieornatus]|uniref:Serine/threonine-protein kinase 1 n=1 Tax=Ramazzottius varieornatus TaxID=947166 RepID=A0A1D1UUY1_RAMVA|nr:hypothetical protein RvY_05421 [Ramazzottius varieornatus]